MSSTVQNLQFLEAQLEQHLHSHEDDGTTLWVTPQGFRMPNKKTRDNLETNMKFLEVQLEKYLHEHEIAGASGFDLTLLRTLDTGYQSAGPAYGDGYLWDIDADVGNTVYRVDPVTAAKTLISTVTDEFSLDGITYSGGTIWVNRDVDFYTINASTGSFAYAFDAGTTAGLVFASGIFHDGTNLWTHDWNDGTTYLLNPSTGASVDSFQLAELSGQIPNSITEVNGNMWFYGALVGADIIVMDKATRTFVEAVEDPLVDGNEYGMASDGTSTVFLSQQGDNNIYVYTLPTTRLVTTHQGFRFPYGWEKDGDLNHNMRFLETEISKYLHKHEEGT